MTYLTNGWEPHLDQGDSMLRRFVLNLVAMNEAIASAAGGWSYQDQDLAIADARRPLAYFNAVVPMRPPADWNSFVDRANVGFASGTGDVYLWSPWPTPDLAGLGWRKEGHPPFLLRPAAPVAFEVDPTAVVVEVRDESRLRQWERLAIEGYPFSQLQPAAPGSLFGPELLDDARFRFFLACHEGMPTSIAAQFVDAGVASFALGVSLPEHRHRGQWRALVKARLDAEPDLPACGVFSDFSRRGAEAAGFLPIQRLTLWSRSRP